MGKKSFNPGKIWPIVQIAARLVQRRPELADDREYLKANMVREVEELKDKEKCPNCGASMIEYVFEFDCLDAAMLLYMGKEVKKRLGDGMVMRRANMVRVQDMKSPTYAMKSRTMQMSKLGLIAQLKDERGIRVPGVWVITRRGFDALRGKSVPRRVKVWRNRIEARTDETTTLSEAFEAHRDKVEELIKRKKTPRADYREVFRGYNRSEWYGVGDVHDGKLF